MMLSQDALTYEERILAARNNAALLNFNTYGIIQVDGKDTLDLLHRLSTNDLLNLKIGECKGTVLATDKGRIIDYVHLLKTEHSLLMLCSLRHEQSVLNWIDKYTITEEIHCEIITTRMKQLSVIGPKAIECVNSRLKLGLISNSCIEVSLRNGKTAMVLCLQEFGLTAVSVFGEYDDSIIPEMFNNIVQLTGDDYETFRVMQGLPLIHHELSEEFNPFEAGLSHAINFKKGCYIGQEIIARLDTYQKVQRRLAGLILSSTPEPSSKNPLYHSGNEVGWLTSVATHAYEGTLYGLAILRKEITFGDNVSYDSHGVTLSARVVDVPVSIPVKTL